MHYIQWMDVVFHQGQLFSIWGGMSPGLQVCWSKGQNTCCNGRVLYLSAWLLLTNHFTSVFFSSSLICFSQGMYIYIWLSWSFEDSRSRTWIWILSLTTLNKEECQWTKLPLVTNKEPRWWIDWEASFSKKWERE